MSKASTFPVPYTARENQSWRSIAAGLRDNALAGFPPRAFDDLAIDRSFAGRRQIILSDPAAIRHVLIENAENYRRTPSIYRLLGPVVGRGLFLAKGEDWRAQRRAAAPAFAPRMMSSVAAEAARAADRLVVELSVERGEVQPYARLQLLALEVAAAALFSLDLRAHGPALRREMQRYTRGPGRPALLDFLLPMGWPSPRSWARFRFRRAWMRRIDRLLTERTPSVGDRPADLFEMLAAAGATHRQLVEQSATMLVAGHETTAVALIWALHLVASVPAVQERIADEAAGLDLGPEGSPAALPRLVYTRAVVDEALRLYPPAFSIVRQARAADEAAGISIPARAVVLIVPWVLHRHRRLWREPDSFEPARFLPTAEAPVRFSYMPFGAGPRACIGAQFALAESVIVLARLVQAFHIEPADHEPVMPVARFTLEPKPSPAFRLQRRSS